MAGYLQGRAIHVDRHLSNVAINYRPTGFIADRVFPIVNVDKQTNMIKTYNQADLFRRESTLRSPGTEANIIDTQVNSIAYVCQNYALKADVTIEDRANADAAFVRDLEEGRVMRIQDALALDWEVRIASQVTNTSNVGTSSAVGSAWSDLTNSDPLSDIWAVMDQVEDATSYRPNRVVMSGEAWRYFARNDKVIDKARGTGVTGGGINATVQQAAALLEVEEINIGQSWYNTAEEGLAQSLSRTWGDHVLVYYAPSRPSVELPSFGYTLRWSASGLPNMTVERLPYNPFKKTDEVEMGYYQDELVTAQPLGALVTNVTSST